MSSHSPRLLLSALITLTFLVLQSSCSTRTPKALFKENVIPKPVSLVSSESSFLLTEETEVIFSDKTGELNSIGNYLANRLRTATGFSLEVKALNEEPGEGNIYLTISENKDLGNEGYVLAITEELITISANEPAGVFRGVQTIRQLLPAAIESSSVQPGPWEIATGTIEDYPAYPLRSSMLDVSRHFFNVDDVKRYIDFLAYYKMNYLHLHLSDDQGWRIEIKSWPNLTEHGGSTEVGGGQGGYYTQDQYREIVEYAAERYIQIIPEIDMPGHTNAALASYPELNCDGKATELYTGIEVGFSSLCTDKEITYKFLDDVIGELAAITPGPYIHIGGDESHSTDKEDYIPFVERVQSIVKSKGKEMIGWDETAQADLKPGALVQLWHNADFGKEAIEKGAKLIMSPATKAYLDMQYDSTSRLGLHWAAYIEVDDGYNWDPATIIPGIERSGILGVEAPLWSETITNMDDIEYLAFPRLPGYAEIGWTPASLRNWEEYRIRLAAHGERFKVMEIGFYPSDRVPWGGADN